MQNLLPSCEFKSARTYQLSWAILKNWDLSNFVRWKTSLGDLISNITIWTSSVNFTFYFRASTITASYVSCLSWKCGLIFDNISKFMIFTTHRPRRYNVSLKRLIPTQKTCIIFDPIFEEETYCNTSFHLSDCSFASAEKIAMRLHNYATLRKFAWNIYIKICCFYTQCKLFLFLLKFFIIPNLLRLRSS